MLLIDRVIVASSFYDHLDYVHSVIPDYDAIVLVLPDEFHFALVSILLRVPYTSNKTRVDNSVNCSCDDCDLSYTADAADDDWGCGYRTFFDDDSDTESNDEIVSCGTVEMNWAKKPITPRRLVLTTQYESLETYIPISDLIIIWDASNIREIASGFKTANLTYMALCDYDVYFSFYQKLQYQIPAVFCIHSNRKSPELLKQYPPGSSELLAPEILANSIDNEELIIDSSKLNSCSYIPNYNEYYATIILLRHMAGPVVMGGRTKHVSSKKFLTSYEAIYDYELNGGGLDIPGFRVNCRRPGASIALHDKDIDMLESNFDWRYEVSNNIPHGSVIYFIDRANALKYARIYTNSLYLDSAMPAAYLAAAMRVHSETPFPVVVSYKVPLKTSITIFASDILYTDGIRLTENVIMPNEIRQVCNDLYCDAIDPSLFVDANPIERLYLKVIREHGNQQVDIDTYVPSTTFKCLEDICEEMGRQECVLTVCKILNPSNKHYQHNLLGVLRMYLRGNMPISLH